MLSRRLRQAPRHPKALAALGALALAAGALAIAFGTGGADAKGGTAKPPGKGLIAPFVTATLPDPVFATNPALIHGFDSTGFIQDATVSTEDDLKCPGTPAPRWGGTVTINNTVVTIPCNLVVQMPANTYRWADFVAAGPPLKLGSGWPSFEIRVVGNEVAGEKIAALAFLSQQSVNTNSGTITKIDYATNRLVVASNDPLHPEATIEINDPNGRFGAVHSPDPRLSVDDQNPTIHAATGYPMCVPRTDPATADDPLCPQVNRPKVDPVNPITSCRNFSAAGLATLPASGELSPPAAGQEFCSQFVMPEAGLRTPTQPDATQQAPFEVGDYIAYSGTLVQDAANGDYISAHTIEANVGIYTQPGTQPAYLAIGEFGVGSADPNATAVSGVAQETQDRMFLEAETTDIKTPADIFMVDVDPKTGDTGNRWLTPFEMTGEPSGGITTQFAGAQPQRIRIRATKAPLGLLSDPTRMVRVMDRTLCGIPDQTTATQPAIDTCLAAQTPVANGLIAGQYAAPTFEYIFPENVKPGDLTVPYDFWHLGFIRCGEGSDLPTGVGPLTPSPWGPETAASPDACTPPPAPAAAGGGTTTPPPAPAATPPAAPAPAAVVGGGAPLIAAAGGAAAKRAAIAKKAAAAAKKAAAVKAAKKVRAKKLAACLKKAASAKRGAKAKRAACIAAARKAVKVR